MIADRIEQAVAEFDFQDELAKREHYVRCTFDKSKRKTRLIRALRERRKQQIESKIIYLSAKYNLSFQKLNQVIFGNYSLKIKSNEE
jgi:hypothetical protein